MKQILISLLWIFISVVVIVNSTATCLDEPLAQDLVELGPENYSYIYLGMVDGMLSGYEALNSVNPSAFTGSKYLGRVNGCTTYLYYSIGVVVDEKQQYFYCLCAPSCMVSCNIDTDGDGIPDKDDVDSANTEKKYFGRDSKNCKVNRNQNLIANPINIFNGNNVEEETDLAFNSPFEENLIFKRYYNSQSTHDSVMGFGWTHNYYFFLYPNYNDSNLLVEILEGTGRGYYFQGNEEDGIFTGAFSENSSISRDSDGHYIWKRENGIVYKFEQDTGKLLSISDKKGNVQSLSYNAETLLETVTDMASGRSLIFHYTAENKIDHISGPVTQAVPDGIWVSFTYDINNNLIGVQYADDENGSFASGFEYLYQDSNDVNNLTGKKDLAGHLISTWIYDENDLAIENINQKGTGAAINYDNPDEVAVTSAYGITSIYHMTDIAGRKKITMTSNAGGCSDCSDGIYKTEFDESTGLPTQREYYNGRIDVYQDYDENDNPQTLVVSLGTHYEQTVYKTYHPTLSVPLTITEKSLLCDSANPDREKMTIFDYDDPSDALNTDIPNEKPTHLIYRTIEKGFTLDNLETIIPFEYITSYSYNLQGQVTQIDGALTGNLDIITFTYDAVTKDLLTITYPIVGTVTLEYDAAGNIIKSIDQNTIETQFTYDGRNRQLSSQANGKASVQQYNTAGKPSSITDRSGQITNFAYNPQGLLEKIINSNGDYLMFAYDDNANRIEESIYSAQEIQTFFKGYDFGNPATNPGLSPGKPWKTVRRNQDNTENLEIVYTYVNGNVTEITTPDNLKSTIEYDTLNRITTSTKIKSDLDQVISQYSYDTHGNLIRVKDAENHETTYTYDDLNRLIKTDSPDTGTTRYIYDESGHMVIKNQNSRTAEYTYDTLGRLTQINYVDDPSSNVTLNYDQGLYGKGRLTGIADPSGICSYAYNSLGYLITEQKTISGIVYTTGYTYDDAGRLTSIEYPSGRTIFYKRDNAVNIVSISTSRASIFQTPADNISFNPYGPLKSFKYGSDKISHTEFDLNYLAKDLTISNTVDMSFIRDVSDNILSVSNNLDPSGSQDYAYDDLYRLTDASGPFGQNIYAYDKVGNRQAKTMDTVDEIYSYTTGTNQLEQIAGPAIKAYTYNENGSIKSVDSRQYFYNMDERLIKVTEGSATLGEYGYNYYGQRIFKTVNAATTLFHYDIYGSLIAETRQDGTLLKEYIYLEGRPLAMIVYGPEAYFPEDLDQDGDVDGIDLAASLDDPNLLSLSAEFGKLYDPETKTYYYHNTPLGNPIMLTDENEQTAWQADYSPFGSVNILVNTIENNLRFPGQYYDAETGLHYNYHRYYDPDTGRYITSDPIGLAGGINPFVYSVNNPINFIDPWGLDTLGIHSNVAPNAGFTAGHAWLSYTDNSGVITNYGLWPDTHPLTPNNGPGSDVRVGMENGQTPLFSRYYDLTTEQISNFQKFLSKIDEWKYSHTCADWASDGVKKSVGDNVDADDWFGFETPRELSESIQKLERLHPTSVTNPLRYQPKKRSSF